MLLLTIPRAGVHQHQRQRQANGDDQEDGRETNPAGRNLHRHRYDFGGRYFSTIDSANPTTPAPAGNANSQWARVSA